MPQTKLDRLVSLPLSAKNWADSKEQSDGPLCPVFGLVPALRLLSSRAVSSARVSTFYHDVLSPLQKGTFLLCQKRDISILG